MSNTTSTPESKLLLTEEQILANNQWLSALRSGEWKQCTDRLCNERENSYCCLGVSCEINKLTKAFSVSEQETRYCFPCANTGTSLHSCLMPIENWFIDLYGWTPYAAISSDSTKPLLDIARLNDLDGKSFNEIASIVEAFLFEHFSNFKIP